MMTMMIYVNTKKKKKKIQIFLYLLTVNVGPYSPAQWLKLFNYFILSTTSLPRGYFYLHPPSLNDSR